jgi:hypothetical protein
MANKTSTTPTNGQSLGFEQQLNIRSMFVVHKTFNIDFGLYVGDCEAAATDKQLDWLNKTIVKTHGQVVFATIHLKRERCLLEFAF